MYYLSKHYKRDYDKSIRIEYPSSVGNKSDWIYTESIIDTQMKDCPIIFENWIEAINYPILDKLKLGSFIPAETIYKWLIQWLSNQLYLKEISPELSNENKITSKGFNKRSFRPKMK